ncbi:MAG TPA: hypothetical protein VJR89_11740 [Polyangiales bacterium]|nr:hypothetical protein [Polyangiales bacterium]
MSSDDRELSEALRRSVAALHDSQLDSAQLLGDDARRRVSATLSAEARSWPRQRRLRQLTGAGALLLSAAAAAVLWVRREPAPREEPRAAAVAPSCGLPLVAANEFQPLADGRRQLVLGRFGELVAGSDTELAVEAAGPCELALRLVRGELAGDLHSLRPARLVVRTSAGDVIVTGTRFSVRSGDEFELLLSSGVVDVVFADRQAVRVQPGTRLHKPRAEAARAQQLSAADEQRLSGLLAARAPQVAVAPEAPKPALRPQPKATPAWLDIAEAERRAGHYAQAREAYRAASQKRDDTAEVALLRWVRLELDSADPQAALRVLGEHGRRFANGRLGAEAGWLEVQVQQALGRADRARAAASKLARRYPGTPQAAAAERLRDEP